MLNNSSKKNCTLLLWVQIIIFNFSARVVYAEIQEPYENSSGMNVPPPNFPVGSKVHVVAPSGKGSASELSNIATYLQNNNVVPFIRPDIYSSAEPIYSNTDDYRAMDLIDALTNDTNQIIWAIRGGAGAARLIPYLETQLPNELPNQKLFIGFSDITVLHTYLIKRYNWTTIHGGMLSQIINSGIDSDSITFLWDIIFNRTQTFEYELECLNTNCQNSTTLLESKIVGGNLVLVVNSIGTAWEIETKGKLLFLEDTGEAPYRTERNFDHLKQSGIINDQISGVLIGDFIGSGDESLNEFVIKRFADSLVNIPVFRLPGVGHARRNLPLPLNTIARIRFLEDNIRILTVDVPTFN